MASSTKPNVQLIKQSIAYRAKYRKGQGPQPYIQTFSPALAVPHPKNRGGDPVVSKRCKQLSGHITTEGHDPVEAASSAVAVEAHAWKPAPVWGSFQKHFTLQVKGKDLDMAEMVSGIQAVIGTLSHSHNNCLSRNIASGQLGCDCGAFSRGDGATKCICLCKPILNDKGCYCLELVRARDASWADGIERGIGYELLEAQMDFEEPDAALVISIALNKKNEAAMETAHTEVMKTLVGLCKPDPTAGDRFVPFEPVRSKMIDLYGSLVDHPNFQCAFRLVLDAGGCDSPHMKDMNDFTSVHVNPKVRKLRFETYAVVAPLPIKYPALKNALVKWAWKQKPTKGWCPVPPSLQHRLDPKSKYAMVVAGDEIEEGMRGMREVFAAVAAKDPKWEQAKIRWVGTMDIGLVQAFLNVPKSEENKTVAEQELALITKCSEFLALRLHAALQETSKDFSAVADTLSKQPKRDGPLLDQVRAVMDDGP